MLTITVVSCTKSPCLGVHKSARVSTAMYDPNDRPTSPRIQDSSPHEDGARDSDRDVVKRCFGCQSTMHLARSCPRGRGRGNGAEVTLLEATQTERK